MHQINWKNILSLAGLLLLLINFAQIKAYIQMSRPFAGLEELPETQRLLVVAGIILVAARIVHELSRPSS